MLVTALVMATLFVVLALLVNTTIYTGNVATRSDVSESAQVVNYRSEAVFAAGETVRYANRNDNESTPDVDAAYVALNESLRSSVKNWSDEAARHDALSGTATRTWVVDVRNGTRIAQEASTRNLSSPAGATYWTPVSGVTAVRGPTMTLDAASLAPVDDDGDDVSELEDDDAFHVETDEIDGERHTLYVYERDDGDVGVTVVEPSGTVRTCGAANDGAVSLDAHAGTFEGETCPALAAFSDADNAFAVRFDDAQNAVGTYSFVVDERADTASVDPSLSLDSGTPFYTAAIYDADVAVTYRSPNTNYNATVGVPDATA
ncbi:hypothetical protein SAMN04488124_1396 [Halogeometricum limi]|uniref:Uncharacterized protein n=2 Tax=Halogeometricum limi TaxID=555875 RepID=A0A1I6GQL9_9EURY|nr:hypothetical protein SAMN04488124_1396 [Halogeometricum limi]